jgi:hypothetical protein
MNQYIITEEQIVSIEEHGWIDAFHTLDQVRSRPYQSERDIEQLKKAIVEVLDTGFESSESDLGKIGHSPKQDCFGDRPCCPVCAISTHQRIIEIHSQVDEIQCKKCGQVYLW